jgi:hypothetical protein
MTPGQLDYVSWDTPQWRRRWPWWTIGIVAMVIAVLIAMLAMTAVPVRRTESRMDAVTGSVRYTTIRLFTNTSSTRVKVSPLETRLKSSGILWTPSWRYFSGIDRNCYGGVLCRGCGRAPEILRIGSVLQEFADASTDAELREFVRIMQSGTQAEQQAAIEAAGEKGLQALSTARQGG